MRIVVLPGDGIGPEITAATSIVLRAAAERFHLEFRWKNMRSGMTAWGSSAPPCGPACWRSCDPPTG